MTLPFTTEQFFDVMHRYNVAVWPAQAVLTLLAVASVALLWTRVSWRGQAICAVLAVLWAWAGVVYHLGYFHHINPAATLFGVAFLSAAVLFAWQALVYRRLAIVSPARAALGLALVAYALAVYPMLSTVFGHAYPQAPTFGLPCPLTIYTVGILVFVAPPYPRHLLLVPAAWAVVGTQAAFLFGVYEDLGLAVAAIAAVWLWVQGQPKARTA
jgi:hypothetical protein